MNQAEAIENARHLPFAEFIAMDTAGRWHAFSHQPEPPRHPHTGWKHPEGVGVQEIGLASMDEYLAQNVNDSLAAVR